LAGSLPPEHQMAPSIASLVKRAPCSGVDSSSTIDMQWPQI
jgi:hypothetical protein